MFIRIKDYLINKDEILYIKLIGPGARIIFKQGVSIAISQFNMDDIKDVDIAPDDEDRTIDKLLCDKDKCASCEYFSTDKYEERASCLLFGKHLSLRGAKPELYDKLEPCHFKNS